MFNATFNNISAILWWSVLLVEETGGPVENRKSIVLNLLENNKYEPAPFLRIKWSFPDGQVDIFHNSLPNIYIKCYNKRR